MIWTIIRKGLLHYLLSWRFVIRLTVSVLLVAASTLVI